MNLPVVLRPEARQEFKEAQDWYDDKREGLGKEFTMTIDDALERIAAIPLMYPKVFEDVRRIVIRPFPYVVLYQIEPDHIAVISVFHTSRDPRIWQERI